MFSSYKCQGWVCQHARPILRFDTNCVAVCCVANTWLHDRHQPYFIWHEDLIGVLQCLRNYIIVLMVLMGLVMGGRIWWHDLFAGHDIRSFPRRAAKVARWWCVSFVHYCRIHDVASRISRLNTKRERKVLEERAEKWVRHLYNDGKLLVYVYC